MRLEVALQLENIAFGITRSLGIVEFHTRPGGPRYGVRVAFMAIALVHCDVETVACFG